MFATLLNASNEDKIFLFEKLSLKIQIKRGCQISWDSSNFRVIVRFLRRIRTHQGNSKFSLSIVSSRIYKQYKYFCK